MNFETRQNMANEIWQIDARSALDKVHQQIKSNTLNSLPNIQNQRHAHGAIQSYWHSCFKLMAPLQVQIDYVNSTSSNESVELKNTGPAIIDLESWRIEVAVTGETLFTFPSNSYIKPNQILKVEQQQSIFMFNKLSPLFNQCGCHIRLLDAEGSVVSAWINGRKAHESVIISHISHDTNTSRNKDKEHIELINLSTSWVDVSGWTICIKDGPEFTFPQMAKMEPCSELKIYANFNEPGCYSFNSSTPIFQQTTSTVALLDKNKLRVNEYHFA